MTSPSLDKDTSRSNTSQSSLEDRVEARGAFKEYVERTCGERYILEHPDLVFLFELSDPLESPISVIPPALELIELAFASLTEAEVQSTDIKCALYTKLFFDETFSIPSSLEKTSVKALVLTIKAISNDSLPIEPKEPRDFMNLGNTLECIIDSEGPSVIQRPTEDSPDYLPHHLTKNSDSKIDFVHPCREYTELFELLHHPNQTDRLSHHNGVLLIPENWTPNYYKYVKQLIENENHGTFTTYMGCCKHNPRLWTKIDDENMAKRNRQLTVVFAIIVAFYRTQGEGFAELGLQKAVQSALDELYSRGSTMPLLFGQGRRRGGSRNGEVLDKQYMGQRPSRVHLIEELEQLEDTIEYEKRFSILDSGSSENHARMD
ncbi:hypothetical protein BCON_0231g00160 [Botryotinia convoluta]|uniref:Uncharacterized protein n=1 Tax=Botryotinia convoluta TaxID=54673 RepID=A0A4Z1HI69_9HELO|nr:hypothetical protein BCON_0231g00160 [Botryotinia convoluta]